MLVITHLSAGWKSSVVLLVVFPRIQLKVFWKDNVKVVTGDQVQRRLIVIAKSATLQSELLTWELLSYFLNKLTYYQL